LEAQRAVIAAEAERRGWTVRWVEDAGVSGKSLRRDGITEALRILKRREASALVVAKLDRLSRSLADFAQLMAAAQRQGWAVVAIDVGVDMTTPVGELVAGVMASVAQWERRMIAQRTREAVAQQRGKVARLAPTDVHARIVALAADGMNAAAIARLLDADGVPTPNGGRRWYPSTVRRMIASARLQGLLVA
jgi:DNA invertase Pin-like site-specific DNA recombinase